MLETDVNIRVVQELMGHAGVKTTGVYRHVMKTNIQGVLSSLEGLMEVGKEGSGGLRV